MRSSSSSRTRKSFSLTASASSESRGRGGVQRCLQRVPARPRARQLTSARTTRCTRRRSAPALIADTDFPVHESRAVRPERLLSTRGLAEWQALSRWTIMSGSQRADLWRGRASPLSAMDLPPILSDFADELAGQGFVVTDAL
jgi:hypothetical protein